MHKVYILAGEPGHTCFVGPFANYNRAHMWVSPRFALWQWFRLEEPRFDATSPEELGHTRSDAGERGGQCDA